MAVTIDILKRSKNLSMYQVLAKITFDSSYPTGGEVVTPAQFGLQAIDFLELNNASGYLFEFDYVNNKIKAITPEGTVEEILLSHGGKDIKGSANTDSETVDADALPTNGASVSALAAVSAGAWTRGALTNPDMGRNVVIVIKNPTGGALALFEGVMTFTVTGTWRGAAQTSTVAFTSTAGNKSVASAKFRYKYGDKPFDTVTNVTLNNVPANALEISAGLGSKIGLPTDLKTPIEADVVKLTKNAADLAVAGLVDIVNMTVNFGVLVDNADINVVYNVGADPEASNTLNLSSLSTRVLVMGI